MIITYYNGLCLFQLSVFICTYNKYLDKESIIYSVQKVEDSFWLGLRLYLEIV